MIAFPACLKVIPALFRTLYISHDVHFSGEFMDGEPGQLIVANYRTSPSWVAFDDVARCCFICIFPIDAARIQSRPLQRIMDELDSVWFFIR